MREIRFGYGLAINRFVIWVLFTTILLVAMVLPLMWYWYDNQLYLLIPIGIFIFFLSINYVLAKRDFLIINSEGITLNYLLRKRKTIKWDVINKVEYFEEWKNKVGWDITYENDADRSGNLKKICTLFIPDGQVAAYNETVTQALKRGFQEYKCHEKQHQDSFEDNAKNDKPFIGFFILSMIWAVLNILYFYLDHLWTPSNLEAIMRCTLIGGERYDTNPNLFLIGVWIYSCLIIFKGMPYRIFKGSTKGTIWLLSILIACTLLAALYSLPTKQKVYLNCSEPLTSPVETLEAKVEKTDYHRRYRYYYVDLVLTDEGNNYKYRYVYDSLYKYKTGIYKGMPAVVKLQKGARGLPIVHEIAIPEIGWSFNPHERSTTK